MTRRSTSGYSARSCFDARADFQIDRVAVRFVDEVMSVRHVRLEASGVARLEHGLAVLLDQHHLAFEQIDKFVFLFVPVAQCRGGAGLERRQVDAELIEAGGDAEPLTRTADNRPD